MTGSGFISRILGFFYRIFLSQTIGANGLGLYQLIFPVFTLCLAVSASGIQTALSRFVASEKDKKGFLWCGILLSCLLAVFFSIGIYLLAPFLSTEVLKEPRTEALLKIMVWSIVPACIHSCFNGYYFGIRNSIIPSACQIIEQLARVGGTLIIYRILLCHDAVLEPIHAVWGLVISEIAGLFVNLTAYWGFAGQIPYENKERHIGKTLHLLAAASVPLTLNHVLLTLSNSLENLLLPQQLMDYGYTADEALSHFGILSGMALSVIFFPSAITNSLSVLLLPRISEEKAKGDPKAVLETIKAAVCCGVALGSLCTFVFLISADLLGTYLFDDPLVGFYIRILSILCPFLYTSGLLSSITNGLGHAAQTLSCNLLGCAIRILAICFLVPVYGMYAYIFSMIAASIIVTAALLRVVRRQARTLSIV